MATSASASAIRAGQAFVELFVKDLSLKSGLETAKRQFMSWGKAIAGVGLGVEAAGLGILGGLGAAVKSASDYGEKLVNASKRTGFAVETLSALDFAAGQSGISFEELEVSIKRFQLALNNGEVAKELGELKLTMGDIDGKTGAEQFAILAKALDSVVDPAKRAAILTGLTGKAGRGGTVMRPLLTGGPGGIEEQTEEARRRGITTTKEEAEANAAFGRELKELHAIILRGERVIGGALIPTLKEYLDTVVDISSAVLKWIKDHRQLAVTVAAVGAGLVVAGGALVALGLAALATSAAIGVLQAVIYGLGFAIGVLKAIAYAELLGPLAAIAFAAVGVALALGYLWSRTEHGKATLKEVGDAFVAFGGRMKLLIGGVADAMAQGDMEAAWKITCLGMEREWVAMIAFMEDKANDFGQKTENLFRTAFGKIGSALEDAGVSIRKTFIDLTAGIKLMWSDLGDWIGHSLDGAGAGVSKAMEDMGASMRRTFVDLIAGIRLMWLDLWTWLQQQAAHAGGNVASFLAIPGTGMAQKAHAVAAQQAAAIGAQRDVDKKAVLDQQQADTDRINAERDAAKAGLDAERAKADAARKASPEKKAILDKANADKAAADAERERVRQAQNKEDRERLLNQAADLAAARAPRDAEIAALDAKIKALREEIAKNRKAMLEPGKGEGGLGGFAGFAEQAKGTFGGSTVAGELGRGDKGIEKIAQAAEEANGKLDAVVAALTRIERNGGMQFA